MITYSWKVNRIEVINDENLQNVAIISYFICHGEDENGLKGQAGSDTRLLPPDPNNFTDINQVTAEQAIDWTLEALGESRIEQFQSMVEQQIEGQKLPSSKFIDLPWMEPQI